jgi:hypothetical protein
VSVRPWLWYVGCVVFRACGPDHAMLPRSSRLAVCLADDVARVQARLAEWQDRHLSQLARDNTPEGGFCEVTHSIWRYQHLGEAKRAADSVVDEAIELSVPVQVLT